MSDQDDVDASGELLVDLQDLADLAVLAVGGLGARILELETVLVDAVAGRIQVGDELLDAGNDT